ncbi:non-canonical purine NTP diphosphatase [Salinimicrobium tongyeongense]|jgi:XTP/dITP diphosphohydrolase|uniref:dITP/XTP pyrophosphatase n=1 Tax=Salinimicrobium tongyeongense TaxID=2809707 RepID=A0ABY6NNS6_9FLAO|nr:non-canonical purine NTP diphosphatase [Salinimicrobium tongyeongense]UZH54560.1 non-canonical purine NTP diphosphatase [Salinimicrobium tongyeongense]
MKLVFATQNKNKVREIQALMPKGIELLSLEDIGCSEDIPETSPTIEGNAVQKADYVKEKYGFDCFADDTGLEVAALNGAPGVYSARYAGEEKSSEANIEKLLQELKGKEDRSARFKTVIALHFEGKLHSFTGICSGNIIFERKGSEGFGYDPVFQPEGKELTFAEMHLQEKSKISHRARATRQLIEFLASREP